MTACEATPAAEWLTAIGTVGACLIALLIALFGKRVEQWFYRPRLVLEAAVRNPDAQKVGRWSPQPRGVRVDMGEAWYFRLRIENARGAAPARNVQVFLRNVERLDGTTVSRFSPMNLKWTHTGVTTRELLLPEVPVFCDFIHVSDPKYRSLSGETLDTVPPELAVLSLDVEVISSANAHLLEPGGYHLHLLLAAENFRARPYVVEVRYNGNWFPNQDQMFDREIGFRMTQV
jgi:hypothetical protein